MHIRAAAALFQQKSHCYDFHLSGRSFLLAAPRDARTLLAVCGFLNPTHSGICVRCAARNERRRLCTSAGGWEGGSKGGRFAARRHRLNSDLISTYCTLDLRSIHAPLMKANYLKQTKSWGLVILLITAFSKEFK